MNRNQAKDHLEAIQVAMHRARRFSEVRSGWFLVMWGILWIVSFVLGQYKPAIAPVVWITGSAIGVVATVLMSAFLYGRRGPNYVPGAALRATGFAVAIVGFDVVALWLLELSGAREITTLVVLSAGLCFAIAGLLARRSLLVPGIVLAASVVAASRIVPGQFYLMIGVIGGLTLLVSGIRSLGSRS